MENHQNIPPHPTVPPENIPLYRSAAPTHDPVQQQNNQMNHPQVQSGYEGYVAPAGPLGPNGPVPPAPSVSPVPTREQREIKSLRLSIRIIGGLFTAGWLLTWISTGHLPMLTFR